MSTAAIETFSAAQAHFSRGEALVLQDEWAAAAEAYTEALAIEPTYVEALIRRAVALAQSGDTQAALTSAEQAARLQPEASQPWVALGGVLWCMGRSSEALAASLRALTCDPASIGAMIVQGNALRSVGRLPEALRVFGRAVELAPHHVQVRLDRSFCLLLAGDFAQGWREYEWRWRAAKPGQMPRVHDVPLWLGQRPIAGKTVLLHAEQGLGDTLQFCRYVPMVAALGARVILAAPAPTHGLLTSLPGIARLTTSHSTEPPAFDLQCPLMSLPLAFGTRIDTVPAATPYLTASDAHRRKWQARLGPRRGLRVGFAWSGNPQHSRDSERSMPLELAAGALADGAEIHCLQRELRPSDIFALALRPGIAFYGDALAEVSDTAALAAEMDLIVSVDTAVLHLAGALGRPAWAMLAASPDWRWMLGRDDTPWYPTMRLFRQAAPGDWTPVLEQIRSAMASFAPRSPR